jgi:hypothetical protein
MAKSYKKNRVLYNFFASRTAHSSLHLGLLEHAKKDFYRKHSLPRSQSRGREKDHHKEVEVGGGKKVVKEVENEVVKEVEKEGEVWLGPARGRDIYLARLSPTSASPPRLRPLFDECIRFNSQPITHSYLLPPPTAAKSPQHRKLLQQQILQQHQQLSNISYSSEDSNSNSSSSFVGMKKLSSMRKNVSFSCPELVINPSEFISTPEKEKEKEKERGMGRALSPSNRNSAAEQAKAIGKPIPLLQ